MPETNRKKELAALINLLDEPDENAFGHIMGRICSFGSEAIHDLEVARDNIFEGIVQERIVSILRSIRHDILKIEFSDWARLGSSDLLKGFLIVTKSQYPEVSEETLIIRIEQLKMDAWLELNDNLTALENIKVLNHIIYEVHHFEPNRTNIHAPENSCLNTLLDSKKGSPLSLGMLYIILARKLNIPVYGVNLPQHFILAYTTEMVRPHPDENDVLFYINPFSNGAIFTRKEIELFIHQMKIKLSESFFAPCTNVDIVKRLILNLKYSLTQAGNSESADDLDNLLNIIE
jgi:regulator of sirC expression with transglutaminase-like and TPR domain